MSRFIHTVDGQVIVGDVAMTLDQFIAIEPAYQAPAKGSGRRYAPGAEHVLSDGRTQRAGGSLNDPVLDAYIARVEVYRQAIEAERGGGVQEPLPVYRAAQAWGARSTFAIDVPAHFAHLELDVLVRSSAAADRDTLSLRLNGDDTVSYVDARNDAAGAQDALVLADVPGAGTRAGVFAYLHIRLPFSGNGGAAQVVLANGAGAFGRPVAAAAVATCTGLWLRSARIVRVELALEGGAAEPGGQVVVRGLG